MAASSTGPLQWSYLEREIDGIGEIYNVLKTPRHVLGGRVLDGYQPADQDQRPGLPGLVLGNSVRSDLRLEFYTFRPAAFLPHLEPNAVRAYQQALPAQFDDLTVELVGASAAQNEYGPAPVDLLTRRVRFRLLATDEQARASTLPIEVADYLIPLEEEWLVVRFSASPDIFSAASVEVESFLNRLELLEPPVTTVSR